MMKGSWKTSAMGWLALVIALAMGGVSVFDSDPTTELDAEAIFKALGGLGIAIPVWLQGIFARDKDVSSEDQKAANV